MPRRARGGRDSYSGTPRLHLATTRDTASLTNDPSVPRTEALPSSPWLEPAPEMCWSGWVDPTQGGRRDGVCRTGGDTLDGSLAWRLGRVADPPPRRHAH